MRQGRTVRDILDSRGDIIRTLYEGSLVINMLALEKVPEKTAYALYKDGFFPWNFNEFGGIENYSETRELCPYEKSLADFVKEKTSEERTAGFIAMDRVSLFILLGREGFCEEYINFGVGVKSKCDLLPK